MNIEGVIYEVPSKPWNAEFNYSAKETKFLTKGNTNFILGIEVNKQENEMQTYQSQ